MRATFFLSLAGWLALAVGTCSVSIANDSDPAPAMAARAKAFLESLTPEQQKIGAMDFADPARRDWHFIPKPTRKGVVLSSMTDEQRKRTLALLATGLSPEGFDTAQRIMELERVLAVMEKNGKHIRDADKYYLTIFGAPGDSGSWGWSFEGHHLSVNYALKDGKIVAATPLFFGANPRLIYTSLDVGPTVGTRTLGDEELTAKKLFDSLNAEQKKKAWLASEAPKYLGGGPKPTLHSGAAVGLAAAEMTPEQVDLLRTEVKAFASRWTPSVRDRLLAEMESDGIAKVTFAWFGSEKLDEAHFFRVHGPSFIIEYDAHQPDPESHGGNHAHTVWSAFANDFGGSGN